MQQVQPRVIYQQDFAWEDLLDAGHYAWGEDGFLKLDGSDGRIACRHLLKEPVVNGQQRLSLAALFVPGHRYRIQLEDAQGNRMVVLTLERNGAWRAAGPNGEAGDTGLQWICGPGASCPESQAERHGASALQIHNLSFSGFDRDAARMEISIDKKLARVALVGKGNEIAALEVESLDVEAGSLIWLRELRQTDAAGVTMDLQRFDYEWIANVAVRPGYPSDKWQATSYRPIGTWMEMRTHYGAVFVRFSQIPVVHGSVEMDLKVDDVDHEVQVNLGHYKIESPGDLGFLPAASDGVATISGGWNADAGIYRNTWSPFRDVEPNPHPTLLAPYGIFVPFDHPPAAAVGRIYHLRIDWDAAARSYQVWIDGQLQTAQGSAVLAMGGLPAEGMDMLMIHAGDVNPWRGPLLRVDWAHVKVTAR